MDMNARFDQRNHEHSLFPRKTRTDQDSSLICLEYVACAKLESLMSVVSLAVFSTGWIVNLEYILWEALKKGDPYPFSAKQVVQLQRLANISGGWVRMHRGERVFVPLNEWRRHYVYQKWLPRSLRPRGWRLFRR